MKMSDIARECLRFSRTGDVKETNIAEKCSHLKQVDRLRESVRIDGQLSKLNTEYVDINTADLRSAIIVVTQKYLERQHLELKSHINAYRIYRWYRLKRLMRIQKCLSPYLIRDLNYILKQYV